MLFASIFSRRIFSIFSIRFTAIYDAFDDILIAITIAVIAIRHFAYCHAAVDAYYMPMLLMLPLRQMPIID